MTYYSKAFAVKIRTDVALQLARLANYVYLLCHCRKHAFIKMRLLVHTTRERVGAQCHGFRMVEPVPV